MWVAVVMAAAMLLRVLSGLPLVSAPHQHGGVYHAHGAGGIAHDHRDDYRHEPDVATVLHRHGDGPYHVHAGEPPEQLAAAKRPRDVETNDFPVYIPVRWPPEAYRKAAEEHSHEDPAAPDEAPEGHPSPYFCAAAMAALEAAPVAEPAAVECAQSILPQIAIVARRFLAGPRQSRAPPSPVLFQNV